jgi:hypothetical protein
MNFLISERKILYCQKYKMSNYQSVKNYNGSLYGEPSRYHGIEYEWEVPDNMVVASPGGVDTVRHHWTKGFYGRGNTSGDIYAGQGDRYISGEYGDLYQSGQSASQDQGYYTAAPDYQYWQNQPPPQYSLGGEQLPPDLGNVNFSLKPQSNKMIKTQAKEQYKDFQKFTNGDGIVETYISPSGDFELLEQSDLKKSPQVVEVVDALPHQNKTTKLANFLIIMVFLFLLFMMFHFWASVFDSAISQKFQKVKYMSSSDGKVKVQTHLIIAIIATILFLIAAYFIGNPIQYM